MKFSAASPHVYFYFELLILAFNLQRMLLNHVFSPMKFIVFTQPQDSNTKSLVLAQSLPTLCAQRGLWKCLDLHVQLDSRCSCGAVFELENSPLLPSGEAEVGVDNFFLFDIHRLIVITFGIPTLQPHRHQSHLDLIFVSLFN